MTTYDDIDQDAPETLERRAEELRPDDQIFTPAGRWETVTAVVPGTFRMEIRTMTGRRSCAWRFHTHAKVPVLRSWRRPEAPTVRLSEVNNGGYREILAGVAANDRRTAVIDGYHLVSARWQGRGRGWVVYDYIGDTTATMGVSKAVALSEVKRLARQHAKALGLPCDLAKAAN